MAEYITPHPHIIQRATDAIEDAWITPIVRPIRGGTDGARLSELWIPCPNLFAWGHNFHSVKEWVSIQDMEKAVEVIVGVVSV
jgi:tripeptide aminopeptidase